VLVRLLECRTLFQCLTEQPRVVVCLKCWFSIQSDQHTWLLHRDIVGTWRTLRECSIRMHIEHLKIYSAWQQTLWRKRMSWSLLTYTSPLELLSPLEGVVFMSFNLKDYCVAFKGGESLRGIIIAHAWFHPWRSSPNDPNSSTEHKCKALEKFPNALERHILSMNVAPNNEERCYAYSLRVSCILCLYVDVGSLPLL